MRENPVLYKVITLTSSNDKRAELEREIFSSSIYSFVLQREQTAETVQYNVRIVVSQLDENNTIEKLTAIDEILQLIEHDDYSRKIVGFHQPSIELIIDLYDPLIKKLALDMSNRWRMCEYEDLYQTCRYCIVKLYSLGYYIHKSLVQKTFEREVLNELRKNSVNSDITIVSLDDSISTTGDEKLTIKDVLEDVSETIAQEEKLDQSQREVIYKYIKDYIVTNFSERQYNMLLRAYSSKNTDDFSRALLKRIKRSLEAKGITLKKLFEL